MTFSHTGIQGNRKRITGFSSHTLQLIRDFRHEAPQSLVSNWKGIRTLTKKFCISMSNHAKKCKTQGYGNLK